MEKIKIEGNCSTYAVSAKFNGIPSEGKPSIPINSYKDQYRDHIIINGMWGVFSLPEPRNKEKKLDLLLHHYIFTSDYVKNMYRESERI